MQTATLAAPVSNRTRRQMAAKEEKPGRSYGWLSAVIVAGLLISMISAAWLNREPENPHENLAWAPGTATAIADDDAWIQDFNPADCSETAGLNQVEIDYQSMSNVEPQGYGVVGPAKAEDASSAVDQYRAMRSCETLTDAWGYWTDARINEHIRVINDRNLAELAELQEYYAQQYPDQFMVIMNDLTISPEIEAEWSAREDAGIVGQPIPLEAKLNPDFAVELNDGRIAFPATVVYSFDDPAIQAYGFPEENPASTVVMIFAMEDGSWKYDDSLALCLVNCENGVGNPLNPAGAEWAQSPTPQACTGQQMDPDVQSFGDMNLADTGYEDRQYEPIGPANANDAASAGDTVTAWINCGALSGDLSQETSSYMTPLGLTSLNLLANAGTGDPFTSAPYLRQWDSGSSQLVASTMNWNEIIVLNEPVRSSFGPAQWEPVISGNSANLASVRRMQQGFNPSTATELSDSRIAIFSLPTISIEDRGAVTYEGSLPLQQIAGVTLQQHNDQWLVDEIVIVDNGVLLQTESDAWWWSEEFDEPEVPWTQPVSYTECPDDAKPNYYELDNPSSTMYTQEDYDQVSPERSYEIVGRAAPEDADAVMTRMRETQACMYEGKSTLKWTVRYEYETRTTDGREFVEENAEERSQGAESISAWLDENFGFSIHDLLVYQDSDELTLDGTESVVDTGLGNPALMVEFSDGRIGVIQSLVVYEPFPEEWDFDAVPGFEAYMMIFVYQDGEWMLDENLPMCIGDCSALPAATPIPADGPWATPDATPVD